MDPVDRCHEADFQEPFQMKMEQSETYGINWMTRQMLDPCLGLIPSESKCHAATGTSSVIRKWMFFLASRGSVNFLWPGTSLFRSFEGRWPSPLRGAWACVSNRDGGRRDDVRTDKDMDAIPEQLISTCSILVEPESFSTLRSCSPWILLFIHRSAGSGVRNAMIAAFQRLELWPPTPPPEGIEDDDCCYEASSVGDALQEWVDSGIQWWLGKDSISSREVCFNRNLQVSMSACWRWPWSL